MFRIIRTTSLIFPFILYYINAWLLKMNIVTLIEIWCSFTFFMFCIKMKLMDLPKFKMNQPKKKAYCPFEKLTCVHIFMLYMLCIHTSEYLWKIEYKIKSKFDLQRFCVKTHIHVVQVMKYIVKFLYWLEILTCECRRKDILVQKLFIK